MPFMTPERRKDNHRGNMSTTVKNAPVSSKPAGTPAVQLTLAQALAKMIKAYGLEYVFGFAGAPQEVLIALQNHEGVKVVNGRSERAALAMADAYARLTGKPTFGIVQFGPGATYLPASPAYRCLLGFEPADWA